MHTIETRHIVHRSVCMNNGTTTAMAFERPLTSIQVSGAIPPEVTALRVNGIWYLPAPALERHLEAQWAQAGG